MQSSGGGSKMLSKRRKLSMVGAGLLVLGFLSGGSAAAHFYPVQGPLASQTAPPVFGGRLTAHADMRSGTFSAALGEGETFKGTLVLVGSGPKRRMGQSETPQPDLDGMDKVWDLVFGSGYYQAHVLGDGQYGRAAITGSKGTLLQIEIHSSVSRTSGGTQVSQPHGVARDSRGNVYKVVVG